MIRTHRIFGPWGFSREAHQLRALPLSLELPLSLPSLTSLSHFFISHLISRSSFAACFAVAQGNLHVIISQFCPRARFRRVIVSKPSVTTPFL